MEQDLKKRETKKQDLLIPMNLRFFVEDESQGELSPNPQGVQQGDPQGDPPPAEKTYTAAELNAREAAARKAAKDLAQKELMKQLGVDSFDPETIALFRDAKTNAENSRTVEQKKALVEAENKQLKEQLAQRAFDNELIMREMRFNQAGISGDMAKVLAKGMNASTTDGDAFEEELSSLTSQMASMTKAKDEPKRVTLGQSSPMAGANMGKSSDKDASHDAEAYQSRYDNAKNNLRDKTAMAAIMMEAQKKGIRLKH
jgi:hypothetical protein